MIRAVRPIKRAVLAARTDIEHAPGKLVATVEAPAGKRKARIVICGNLVEQSAQSQEQDQTLGSAAHSTKTKTWETHASDIDGITVRAMLRKAGNYCSKRWKCASIDVRTAFLLAPRRARGFLVVKPPRVLIAGRTVSSIKSVDCRSWWVKILFVIYQVV